MTFNFRNSIAWILARMITMFGFVKRAKKRALKGEYILSLYFHSPGKKLFEHIIKWFLKNGFHFISVKDLELIIKGEMGFPKGAVLLTFDDGWLSNEENVIAIADTNKIPVTIFVTTDAIRKGTFWWSYTNLARRRKLIRQKKELLKKIPNEARIQLVNSLQREMVLEREAMTIEQVKKSALSENVTIGAHTVAHPILINCDDIQSFYEIQESKLVLEEWLHKEINTFSFPNGDYSLREIQYLKHQNFNMAFTTEEAYLTPEKLLNKYTIPRFYINESASVRENICRMMGVWFNKATFTGIKQ